MTTRLKVANNARTTLVGSITAIQTSFVVAASTLFPDAPFRISIDAEIIEVGAINRTTHTFSSLIRGLEGTTAATHNAGASIENRWTAGTYDELAAEINAAANALAAGGTATAITLTVGGMPGYSDGSLINFVAASNNGGAATTVNVNGLGAMPLYKVGGTSAPSLIAGRAYTIWYNAAGGNFFFKASADGTAAAGDVLAGKTYSSDSGTGLTGTMANRTGATAAGSSIQDGAGTLYLRPVEGFYPAGSEVSINDPDFIAGNIPNTKNIFGLQGSLPVKNVGNGNGTWAPATNHHTPSEIASWTDGNLFVRPNNLGLDTVAYAGDCWLRVNDPDFIAANIRNGFNIFGLVGSFTGIRTAYGNATTNAEGRIIISGLSFTPKLIIVTNGISNYAVYNTSAYGTTHNVYSYGSTDTQYYNRFTDVNLGFTLTTNIASYPFDWIAVE